MRVGVDLGGTKIEAIALDRDGHERGRLRVPTPQHDYVATVQAVADAAKAVANRAGTDSFTVGVGMPGALHPRTGLVQNANSTWLIGKPIDQDLGQALDQPVRCANDANCFALSEAVDGAGKGAQAVFGVILGTGVGGSLVVEHKALTGPNAIAGEWGHLPLPWSTEQKDGPPIDCYCGLQGCIETHLSGPALARHHRRIGGSESFCAEQITHHATIDDTAKRALDDYVDRLARALALIINIADPDVIVLGGGLSNIQRLYDDVPHLWHKWAMTDQPETKLLKNKHGDSSGVRGAAWLWNDAD